MIMNDVAEAWYRVRFKKIHHEKKTLNEKKVRKIFWNKNFVITFRIV